MTIPQLAVILQSISSLAIAGGFIFAAIQFRHHRRAAHVANFTKLVELQLQLRRMRVEDPRLAHVYKADVATLHTDKDIREYYFNLMQLSVFEIVWFSYKEQQLPREYFRSWDRRIRDIARESSFQAMMSTGSVKILHDDFQAYVMQLVAEVEYAAREGR